MWTEERRELLAEGNALLARARALDDVDLLDDDPWPRIWQIADRYRALLPEVTVARCPYTGALVRWPIDTAGLDGWFWAYGKSISRFPDPLPATWLAMPGAMRLTEPVEHTRHRVMPGPGVPYVVRRLVAAPDVRAVIAEVPVGRHTGWAISYFGERPPGVRLLNLWGKDDYPVNRDDLPGAWGANEDRVSAFDFELGDWLRSGKLLWIAPGDDGGSLREGADDCPYLDLPGHRRTALVEIGRVWR